MMFENLTEDEVNKKAELKFKKIDDFFNPLNKVIKISFWVCLAGFFGLVCYLQYLLIFKQNLIPFTSYFGYLLNYSLCFLICFYAIKNFFVALESRMNFKVLEALLERDGSLNNIASLRISHNNLYVSSHVALFIFGLSLAFLLQNYGNIPLTEAKTVMAKPGTLICISALFYFVVTRIFFYFSNKRLEDALFYAQIERYKKKYYQEKAEKEQLNLKDKI